MGSLAPDEGVFFNVNIPVKGLETDVEVVFSEIEGHFDDVRVW